MSKEKIDAFRLTRLWIVKESGVHDSTKIRKIWPYLVEHKTWFPLGRILMLVT
jgi:hypothetical protein